MELCLGTPCPPLPPLLPGGCQGRRARSSSPDPSYLLAATCLEAVLCLAPSPVPSHTALCGRVPWTGLNWRQSPGPRTHSQLEPHWGSQGCCDKDRGCLAGSGTRRPSESQRVVAEDGMDQCLPLHLYLLGGCGGLQRGHHMSLCPSSPALCPSLLLLPKSICTYRCGGKRGTDAVLDLRD